MTLVLSVCLLADPGRCGTEDLPFGDEPVPLMACMMTAPQVIAAWSEAHPAYVVRSWRCSVKGSERSA